MSPLVKPREAFHRRTFQPVRAHSRLVGRCEAMIWRPFDRRQVARYLQAAEKFDLRGKKPNQRYGPLGTNGPRVLRELLRMIDFKSGRLDPAIATLMARLKLSKTAVVRALRDLKTHRFIDWIRRLEPTDAPRGVRGPQVKQATNAYEIRPLPPAAEATLNAAPEPEDFAAARAARSAELRAMAIDAYSQTPAGQAFDKALARRNASPPSGRNPS